VTQKPNGTSTDKKAPADNNSTIMNYVDIGIMVATIVVGLVWCIAGYRLVKPVLFVAGFALLYFIVFNLLVAHTNLSSWISVGISAGAGLLGGIMLLLLFKIGVFLMGFIFGAVVATVVVAFTPLNGIIVKTVASTVSVWVFLACIIGLESSWASPLSSSRAPFSSLSRRGMEHT